MKQQDFLSTMFGFQSRGAVWTAKIGIAMSSLAALAAIPGWENMLGCLGFLGMIGIATIVETIARRGRLTTS